MGEELRELRTSKKLTQLSLAALAGVHINVVGRLEKGSYNPTVLLLSALAIKLEVSMAELFAGAEERMR